MRNLYWHPQTVDPVVVDRVCTGDRLPTNHRERREVVARLTSRGESAELVAARLGITERSVFRYRRSLREGVYA